jgi:phospho-N-acetylmuramoyl-pentapeptide-transferase
MTSLTNTLLSETAAVLGRGDSAVPSVVVRLLPAMLFGVASFVVALLAAPAVIVLLKRFGARTRVRSGVPSTHAGKAGTPTMGGLIFSGTTILLTVAFNLIGHYSQLLTLGSLAGCTALGMVDDILKLRRVGDGLRASLKLTWTLIIGIGIVAVLHIPHLLSTPNDVWIPSQGYLDFGWAYWPLAVVAIAATSHAVNLTDGVDGLAAGSGAMCFATFGAIALLRGQLFTGEFCFTMAGAVLAFLWFNIFPARVFMGDTGSLALGATLATVALLLNQLFILPVIGLLYVLVTLSVMLQVGYFKVSGGHRLLRKAPLHHHLEELGWHEKQVTQRLWIISVIGAVAGIVLAFF